MQRGFPPFARVWRAKCRFSLFSQSNKSGSTMSLKFFTIPIQDLASSEGELNSFMANHRVLSVDRHFVDHGASSFWTVCVDFLDGQPATSSDSRTRRAKVDYRDLRKEISQEEGVPVYTVFVWSQLNRRRRMPRWLNRPLSRPREPSPAPWAKSIDSRVVLVAICRTLDAAFSRSANAILQDG